MIGFDLLQHSVKKLESGRHARVDGRIIEQRVGEVYVFGVFIVEVVISRVSSPRILVHRDDGSPCPPRYVDAGDDLNVTVFSCLENILVVCLGEIA